MSPFHAAAGEMMSVGGRQEKQILLPSRWPP